MSSPQLPPEHEEVIIRPGTPGDADVVADLHARSWQATYRGLFSDDFLDEPVFAERNNVWTQRLTSWDPARNVVLLALRAGRIEGFASVLLDTEPQFGARLDNLHVDPALKGRGMGRRLMQAAAAWVMAGQKALALHLMVFEGNEPARKFYDSMDGKCIERRDVIVEDGTRLTELRYQWQNLPRLAGCKSQCRDDD